MRREKGMCFVRIGKEHTKINRGGDKGNYGQFLDPRGKVAGRFVYPLGHHVVVG